MNIVKILTAAVLCAALILPSNAAEAGLNLFGKKNADETEILPEDCTPKRGRFAPDGDPESGEAKAEVPETRRHHGCRKHRKDGSHSAQEEASVETAAVSWYCAHEKDGKRPACPAEVRDLEARGGYYLGADEPVIYLTFDAGYENGNVEKILDTLKAENVPGAFFILDHLVEANPELVKRMAAEGHTVANHTAKHHDMSKATRAEFETELRAMEDAYRNLTGAELAKYYRPPEGKFTEENLVWAKDMGYSTILWSYAYADWDNAKQMDPEAAVEKVMAGTHNGEVILLHPTSATNAEILPELIRRWRDMGYRFGTLDELTGR